MRSSRAAACYRSLLGFMTGDVHMDTNATAENKLIMVAASLEQSWLRERLGSKRAVQRLPFDHWLEQARALVSEDKARLARAG